MAARESGNDVSVITRTQSHGAKIKAAGLNLIPLEFSRRGVNPLTEIRTLCQLLKIYRAEKPDIVHHVALKPVLYGTLVARLAGVPHVVNALAGLGFLFSSNTLQARVARPFIKYAFHLLLNARGSLVILQNPDDVELMCKENVLQRDRIVLIRGSGVDINKFMFRSAPQGEPLVLLASRLLWDKGIGEFVSVARSLRRHRDVGCCLFECFAAAVTFVQGASLR